MDGSMESNQMSQLREIFDRFDMDSDGSLSLLELAAFLHSLSHKPTRDQLDVLLTAVDANGNGSIEYDELMNGITTMNYNNEEILASQCELIEVFRVFDKDGNGVITVAELAGAMAKMGRPLAFKELSRMMNEADLNGDGVINFREFASIMAQSSADFLGVDLLSVSSS